MLEKRLQVQNKLGLHARASAKLVQIASRFACEVWITYDNQRVNGKSIMGVMMLAASFQTWLDVQVSGEDAADALKAIEQLFNDKFGED